MRLRAPALALALLLISTSAFSDTVADLLASGKKAFADGQYPLAARSLQKIVDEYPESPRAQEAGYLLGVSHFYAGSYEEALSALGALRTRSPKSPLAARAGYWLGASNLKLGRYEKALELLVEQISRTGADATYRQQAMLLAGTALEELGRDVAAAARYRALLGESPSDAETDAADGLRAEALFRLAGTEYRAGRFTQARDMYAKVSLEHPRSVLVRDSVFFLAECELALGNLAGAEKRYRTVLTVYTDSPYKNTASLRLADIAARGGRSDEALQQVDALLKQAGAASLSTGARAEALRLRGDILFDKKGFEAAIASYTRARELTADEADRQAVQYAMGLATLGLGKKAEAALLFDAARTGPNPQVFEKASFQLAVALSDLGKLREAARALSKLAADRPKSARAEEALRLLATTLEKTGDSSAAVPRWDALVRGFPRSPTLPEYLYRRGLALMKVGKQALALEDFQRVVKEFPRSPLRDESAYSIGYIYSQRGEHGRAVPFFQSVPQGSGPGDLAERSSLAIGICWFNMGSYEKALASFESLAKRSSKSVSQGIVVLHAGRTLYRMERLEQAVSRLGEASDMLQKQAEGADALYWLGWSLFRLNRLEEAREAFLGLAERHPSDGRKAEAVFRAGVCETLRADDPAAIAFFDRALGVPAASQDPDIREQALYEKAWALSRLAESAGASGSGGAGGAAAAGEAFEALARAFPSGKLAPEAFFRRASKALEQKRFTEAREGFGRVGRDFPRSAVADQALYWAAETSLEAGDARAAAEGFWSYASSRSRGSMADPAMEGFAKSIAAADSLQLAEQYSSKALAAKGLPAETLGRIRLAHARLLLQARPRDALALLSDMRGRSPAEPLAGEVSLLLGQALAATGEGKRALDIFTALADSRADRVGAEAKREQARALEAAGSTAEAVDEFVRISYLFPDFPDLAAEGLFNAVRVALLRGERDRARGMEETLRKGFPESEWTAKLAELR
jgi:TolA-binding protein